MSLFDCRPARRQRRSVRRTPRERGSRWKRQSMSRTATTRASTTMHQALSTRCDRLSRKRVLQVRVYAVAACACFMLTLRVGSRALGGLRDGDPALGLAGVDLLPFAHHHPCRRAQLVARQAVGVADVPRQCGGQCIQHGHPLSSHSQQDSPAVEEPQRTEDVQQPPGCVPKDGPQERRRR